MLSRAIKFGFWIIIIALAFNLLFGEDDVDRDEMIMDVDYDKVVDYTEFSRDPRELQPDGQVLNYAMVINEEASHSSLQETIKIFLNTLQEEKEFNAVVIELYDNELYVDRIDSTLGRGVFAPEGRLDLAETVNPGEHHNLEFTPEFYGKDWDARPPEEETKIWAQWHDYQEELREEGEVVLELEDSSMSLNLGDVEDITGRLDEAIGKKHGLSPEEIAEIRDRQQRWQLQDIQK